MRRTTDDDRRTSAAIAYLVLGGAAIHYTVLLNRSLYYKYGIQRVRSGHLL